MPEAGGRATAWLLEDQLTPRHPALARFSKKHDVVLMVESLAWARRIPHHKKKLVLVWSAMRHFADELRAQGYTVDYRASQPDHEAGLEHHLREYRPARLLLMESAEYSVSAERARPAKSLDVEILPNNMFLSDPGEFARWAKGRKSLRLETFYRRMRKATGLLMTAGKPAGGKWNYDAENRQTPPADARYPKIPSFRPDKITREVAEMVGSAFPDHFGSLDGFDWPVTRRQAEKFFHDFLERRLDLFGDYQDAIVAGEPFLYHSLISPLLNIGLLEPLAVCREAERRYRGDKARLNSVEGFIRQIIGWREYVYQVYRLKMPDYARENFFDADLPLPEFYWTADTEMRCVADAVKGLLRNGINHHIQRLMVTGNFALIAGIEPQQVNEWYWLAYADAWEWVVTPNVLGLALYADGGLLASKPYAASARYIDRMSDCCRECAYNPRETVGEAACPFNSLYWDFLDRNREKLEGNRRMSLILGNLRRRKDRDMQRIREQAAGLREKIRQGGTF